MAERVQPSTRGFYLLFVSRNAVARFCPDLVNETTGFKEKFWDQFVNKGKPGRAFDGIAQGSIPKFQAAAQALLAGCPTDRLQLLASEDLPADFNRVWIRPSTESALDGRRRLARQVIVDPFALPSAVDGRWPLLISRKSCRRSGPACLAVASLSRRLGSGSGTSPRIVIMYVCM